MKKLMILAVFALTAIGASAQKFARLDMEYILKNIPAYERANEQLNRVSKKWQAEVEALNTAAATMYKNYQNESVFLSQEQKKAKQDDIMKKEKAAADLKKKYFGPDNAYPGRGLQHCERDFRATRLFACHRPKQR